MDLIIRIRLEALKNNLTKIRGILESVKDRGSEINKLSDVLTHAQDQLNLMGENVTTVLNTSRNTFANKKIDEGLMRLLEVAEEKALTLRQDLEKTKQAVKAIQTRWTLIEEGFEARVKEDLEEKIGSWSDEIDADIEALSGAPPTKMNQQVEKAWRDCGEIMSTQSQLVFSAYVEFLGGLALRGAGLDEGICRIADELMGSCGTFGTTNWSALTIPASQEAMTLARSIRMRFPEWTIWAVPLTAHELGQVVISGNLKLEKYINSQYPAGTKKTTKQAKRNQLHMRICLADAFATYVMGPAYACSVILLRFNPFSGYDDKGDHPADAKRAHVVLSMLKKMGGDSNIGMPYDDILKKLGTEWDAALAQAQAQAPATWNQDVNLLEEWTDRLLEELRRTYPNSLYEGGLWKSTREALELLLMKEVPGDKLKGREDWGDVLNAAWACRVDNKDESKKIARRAEELWQLIEQKKREIKRKGRSPSGFAEDAAPRIQAGRKS
jgi:hypothetical protein